MARQNREHHVRLSGHLTRRAARRAAALAWCSGAVVAGLNLADVASAADISWIGAPATPLDFGAGSNWAGGVVPDAPDNAFINNGGIAAVATGFTRTMTNLRLGSDPASSGALTQTGGTLNATTNMYIGTHTTGTGTLSISGGDINVGSGLVGDLSIGEDGAGTAIIGGGVINTRFAFLGKSTNGHGHVIQTGGTLAVQRNLVMAELKPADLVALQNPSDYTMSAGTITVGEEMYIGAHGPSTFNLSSTGAVIVAGVVHIGASSALGDPPGGIGTLNMSGGTINVTGANAHFVIGDGGTGTMNFSGGSITTKFYNTGQNFGAVGVVNHTEGAATAEFAWVVGEVSRGANLYDLSGGTVTVVGAGGTVPGTASIGSSDGAKGTLKVRGTGVANIGESLRLGGGNFSGGTLEVSGGTVAVGANGNGTGQIIVGDRGTGTLIISGGHVSTDLVTLGQNEPSKGTGTQTGGTLIVRSNVSIGETSLADNVLDISAGAMSVGGGIYIGSTGNGTLKVGATGVVSSALTIENAPSGGGTIDVSGGSLTAPSLNNRGLYSQSGGSASLGDVTGPGQMSVSGGSLAASSIAQGTLLISSTGSVAVAPNGTDSGLSVVSSLSITGSGRLNLADNDMVVDYSGPSVASDVRLSLISGRNNGLWNGAGINSSSAATSPNAGEQGKTALGYGESAIILGASGGTFGGQLVDDTAVLVKYTYSGDSNLDGKVDITDLGQLATNWQMSSVWTGGDFDYSGFVDITDLGMLATNWQAGVVSPLGPLFNEALGSLGLPTGSVPEPAVALLLSAVPAMLRPRRVRAGHSTAGLG